MSLLLKDGGGGGAYLPNCDKLQSHLCVYPHTKAVNAASAKGSNYNLYSSNINVDNNTDGVSIPMVSGANNWQTVIDETGNSGVLGCMITPYFSIVATVDIEVTIDGEVKIYTFTNVPAGKYVVFGSVLGTTYTASSGSTVDYSFYPKMNSNRLISTTREQIAQGAPVVFYNDQLKVRMRSTAIPNTYMDRGNCDVIRRKTGEF